MHGRGVRDSDDNRAFADDNFGIYLLIDRIFPDGDDFEIVPAGNNYRRRRS